MRATLTLTVFVLSQWVLPQVAMLQGEALPRAYAADRLPAPVTSPVVSKSNRAAKPRTMPTKLSTKAIPSAPAPAWYRAARLKEAQRVAETKRGMRLLLAQNARLPRPSITRITPRAEAASGTPLLRDNFPGDVRASAPLSKMPYITPLRLNLSNERVPSQKEVVAEGGLAGPLNPVAPADPAAFETQINDDLKGQGFTQGLNTPFPTEAQAEARQATALATRTGNFAGLVAQAKHFADAKERVKKAKAQNREFALAISKWNDGKFKAAANTLKGYVKKYPKSPWLPEALIHIANYAKFTGQSNDSEDLYRQVIDMTSSDPAAPSYNCHRKAIGRLTDLYLIEKRYGEVRPLLEDFLKNDTNWRRRTWGLYWLRQINALTQDKKRMLAERDCGTQALAALLEETNHPHEARRVFAMQPRDERGFSLADLHTIAAKQGVPLTGFGGTPAQIARLPLPLLLHYSDQTKHSKAVASKTTKAKAAPYGHFVLARSYNARNRTWTMLNPQDGITTTLTSAELARQWSGKGLMLSNSPKISSVRLTLPKSAKTVVRLSMAQMRSTFGTGYAVKGQSKIGCPKHGVPIKGSCGVKGGKCGKSKGEPSVMIDPISQNIFVTDTPVWYQPAKGPEVDISLSYNSQDASNYNAVMGNKWSFNYTSYIAELPNRSTVYMADGSQLPFLPPSTETGYTISAPEEEGESGIITLTPVNYDVPRGYYWRLQRVGSYHHYVLSSRMGEHLVYGIPTGVSTTIPVLLQEFDRFGQAVTLHYGTAGGKVVPTSITDASGGTTRLQYDGDGHLIYAQTPDERQASFSYDANGNLIQCVDAAGQAFQYAYDDMVNLTQINTAQGPWTFEVESDGGNGSFKNYKTTITDPSGGQPEVVTFLTTDPYTQYHNPGHYFYTDHRGNSTDYTITTLSDTDGSSYSVLSSVSPPGVTSTSYDYSGTPSYSEDPSSSTTGPITTTYSYNDEDLPTQISSHDVVTDRSYTQTYSYDSNGLDLTGAAVSGKATASSSPLPQTVLQDATYNASHQPTQITDAAGNVTDFTYTSWGAPATSTSHEGTTSHVTTYVYGTSGNDLNRIVGVQYDSTTLATATHDESGRVASDTDSSGLTTSYSYNNLDSPTATFYPDGTKELVDYTCCSLPGMVTDRSGRKSYYDYDSLKQPIRVQDADGQTLQFEYDGDGNQTGLLDAKGNWTYWKYDQLSRPTAKFYADGQGDRYAYATRGWLDHTVSGRGKTTNYTHDNFGLVTAIAHPTDSDLDVSMEYDDLARGSSVTDTIGTTSWDYDSAGRLLSEDGPWDNDTLTYGYDDLDRASGLSVQRDATNSDTMSYGYDALSRLSSISANAGGSSGFGSVGTFSYSYVGNSELLDHFDSPNGTRVVYGYEGSSTLKRLISVQNILASTSANQSNFDYSYGSAAAPSGFRDNRTSQTKQYGSESAQTVSYGYNPTSMLTSESGAVGGTSTPAFSRASVYDAMGNRTQWSTSRTIGSVTTPQRFDATYNRLNQLTEMSTYNTAPTTPALTGTTSYAYDGDGNQTGITERDATGTVTGGTTYTYDENDRLTKMETPGSSKWEFEYDSSNRLRISKQYNWVSGAWHLEQEKHRVYEGMDIVQERDENNEVTASVFRNGNIGGILARVTATGTAGHTFYGYDGNGNVTTLTDGTGSVTGSYTYDAFGVGLTSSTTTSAADNPYRYSTKEAIGGLYSYGFRFYSPGTGRWINRDPIGENGGSDLYAFNNNSPTIFYDDYGFSPCRGKNKGRGRETDAGGGSKGWSWPNPRKAFWTGDWYASDQAYNDAVNDAGDWWYNDSPGRGWYGEWNPNVPSGLPIKPKFSAGWTVDNGWAGSLTFSYSKTSEEGVKGSASYGRGWSEGSGWKPSYGMSFAPDIQTPLTPVVSFNTSDPLNGGKDTVRGGFRDTRQGGTGLGFGGIWGIPPSAR